MIESVSKNCVKGVTNNISIFLPLVFHWVQAAPTLNKDRSPRSNGAGLVSLGVVISMARFNLQTVILACTSSPIRMRFLWFLIGLQYSVSILSLSIFIKRMRHGNVFGRVCLSVRILTFESLDPARNFVFGM